jgi:hypothetical protein
MVNRTRINERPPNEPPPPPLPPPTFSNPAPGVFITAASRYRVKGRISPVDRAGTYYDVDLVVEAIP